MVPQELRCAGLFARRAEFFKLKFQTIMKRQKTVPKRNLDEFNQLPVAIQAEIKRWLIELFSVSKPIQKSFEAIAVRMGVSWQTCRAKYYAWIKRGWRSLINHSKVLRKQRYPAPVMTLIGDAKHSSRMSKWHQKRTEKSLAKLKGLLPHDQFRKVVKESALEN